MFADEAHRVRFVDQHHRARFLGNADHLRQRCDVAQHRIDAFEHDQLARIGGNALQPLLERFDIVVAEGDDLGPAHRAAIVDRGMAVDIQHHVIALAGDGGDDPEVGLVAGGKDHRVVHSVEFLERVLALLVALIRAIEHAAAGGPATEFLQRLLARLDHVRIEGHTHVVVGAEQDRLAPVADRAGGREDLFHHQVEGIFHPAGEQAFAHCDQIVELGEKIALGAAFTHYGRVRLADAFTHRAITLRRPVSSRHRPAGRRSRSRPAGSSR